MAKLGTYKYRLIFKLACDPDTRVHDLKGTVELESGESIRDAPDFIINQYVKEERIRHAFPARILEWDYR